MANQIENFDQLLRDAVEGSEVPFNEAHWKELEDELNVVSPSVTGYFSAISTGIVATSLVFVALLFMFSDGNSSQEVIVENDTTLNLNSNYNSGDTGKLSQVNSFDSNIENGVETINQNNTNEESITTNINGISTAETVEKINVNQSQTSSNKEKASNSEKAQTSNNRNNESNDNKVVATSVSGASTEKSNVRKGCTGLTIAFDASEEYGAKAKYLWNFGDGFFSNEANPSHTFNKEGVFDVSLSVTSVLSGQITSNVVQAMIEIEEAPIANLDFLISDANTITLNNKSFNANDVEWSLDGVTYGNGASIAVSVADNTNYELQLSAINEGGCVDTLLTKIKSIKAGSEFPRAIDTSYGTPFAPGAILVEGEVTSVKVFDVKNGNLVFEGAGNKGWMGNLPSGNKAQKGNYKWIMTVEHKKSIDVYHGNLELR